MYVFNIHLKANSHGPTTTATKRLPQNSTKPIFNWYKVTMILMERVNELLIVSTVFAVDAAAFE